MSADYALVWNSSIAPPAPFSTSILTPSGPRVSVVTATSAQMKNVLAAPIVLAPAPGAGKYVRPHSVTVTLTLPGGSAVFTTAGPVIYYATTGKTSMIWEAPMLGSTAAIDNIIGAAATRTGVFATTHASTNNQFAAAVPPNEALLFGAAVNYGGQADGLATVKFTTEYSVLPS